jgi:ABC-2 type transport system ATP-binding protein
MLDSLSRRPTCTDPSVSILARREGVTVFLTTHNLAEAEELCSRVAVIRNGKLLAVGHPDELRAQRGGRRTEIVGRVEEILGVTSVP